MNPKGQRLLFLLNSNNPEILDFDKSLVFAENRKEVFNHFVQYADTNDIVRMLSYENPFSHLTRETQTMLKARFAGLCANNHVCSNWVNERMVRNVAFASFGSSVSMENSRIQDFHRIVSYTRFFESLNWLSLYSAMHPKLKAWICKDLGINRFGASNGMILLNFLKDFHGELKMEFPSLVPEIPEGQTPHSYLCLENTRSFRSACNDALSHTNDITWTTCNPAIRQLLDSSRSKITGENMVMGGLTLLAFLSQGGFQTIATKLRNIRKYRKFMKRDSANITYMADKLQKTLTELSENNPRTWETSSSITSFSRLFAQKKFPKNSLVGVEIEFVGTRDTMSQGEYEVCGDCDVCNDPESEEICEHGRYTNSLVFPDNPFVWWKRDGSVSAVESEQAVLEFQEVNIVCNITDKHDSKRIGKTLEWMNSRNMLVNRTCGLHVHVDCRGYTSNMVSRKCTKMEEAMKSWIQFMVPFKRSTNSYCRVYGGSDSSRYNAVNRLSWSEHQTIEIRVGSASLNTMKVVNWSKLMHYLIHTREDISTITEFLKSDASPELKAFAISRIVKFYQGHKNGRTMGHKNHHIDYITVPGCSYHNEDGTASPVNPKSIIPAEISDIYNCYNSVQSHELTESSDS